MQGEDMRMVEPSLLSALNHAFETSLDGGAGVDDRLGFALIWLIELYASQLAISYYEAAEQIGLMCELTRIIELQAQDV